MCVDTAPSLWEIVYVARRLLGSLVTVFSPDSLSWMMSAISIHQINLFSALCAVLLFFLSFIVSMILGFGKAQYIGNTTVAAEEA